MTHRTWPPCRSKHSAVATKGMSQPTVPFKHPWNTHPNSLLRVVNMAGGVFRVPCFLTQLRGKPSCTARSGERVHQVRQKHLTVHEIWKPSCLLRGNSILTVVMCNYLRNKCSGSTDFPARSQDKVPTQNGSSVRGILPARSPHLAVPDHFLRSYVKRAVHERRLANTDNFKTMKSGMYSWDP
jgi:hypothetical protein